MSSDSTSGKISFPVLTKNNYNEWAGNCRAALMTHGYWRLVSGKEVKPSTPDELLKWEIKSDKAAGLIYLAVGKELQVLARPFLEDPVAMWKALESQHVSKKPGSRFNAYNELFSISKRDDESLIDMATRIETAMQQIFDLRPATFTLKDLDSELQSMALIRALPEEYKHLSSNLLVQDQLNKDKILDVFLAQQLQDQHDKQQSVLRAALAQVKKKGGNQDGRPKGKPWGFCPKCGKKGHWSQDCSNPVAKKGTSANKAKVEEVDSDDDDKVVETAGAVSSFSLNALASNYSDVVSWNTDTGATSHMTPHKHWIRDYTPHRVPVRLADNTVVHFEGIGNVLFSPTIKGIPARDLIFSRVLHVPALNNNLLSVLYLTKHKGFTVQISKDSMQFLLDGNVCFTASVNNKSVGYLDGHTISTSSEYVNMVSTLPLTLELWHRRFFHYNFRDVSKLSKSDLVKGFKLDSTAKPDPICEPCLAGKMHSDPFPSSDTRATRPLEKVYCDLHDVGVCSAQGYRYWLIAVDDCTSHRCVVPLKKKSEAFKAFKFFKAWAENVTGMKMKIFRHDKGTEFMSKAFREYLAECGIEVQMTTRNRPQQNGHAERANRTVGELLTAMLAESGLPKTFWVECLAALICVLNCCPTSTLPHSTPHEAFRKEKPRVDHFRVWGCVAYVHVQKDKRKHLGSHMEKCIFIGYPEGMKGWCWRSEHC